MRSPAPAPHRLYFAAAALQLLVAGGWWAWALAALTQGMPPPLAADLDTVRVHAFLMLYTFLPLFAFGHLFESAARMLRLPPMPQREGLPPAAFAVAASALIYPALAMGARALAVAVILVLLAWTWNLARIVRLVLASRADDRVAYGLAAGALGAGALGLAAMALDLASPWEWPARAMESLGLWGFALPFFLALSHRSTPLHEGGGGRGGPSWSLAILIAASVAHGALVMFDAGEWTWIVDGPLAFALAAGTLGPLPRAGHGHDTRVMLHFATAWLALAFGLATAQSALRVLGFSVLGLAPVHALAAGYVATVAFALVTAAGVADVARAASDRFTRNAFWLLQAAAIARVAADLWPAHYRTLLLEAAALWLACFVAWAWRYLPTSLHPRTHGRPG